MHTKNQTVTMTEEEARARIATLVQGTLDLMASKCELTDIVLTALLQSYLTVADQTGRLHEVLPALLRAVEAIAESLADSRTTKH